MNYKSTRNSEIRYTASQVIARGISEEGGLFVPENIPFIGNELKNLIGLDYKQRAEFIFKLFLTDFSDEEIKDCVEKAYDYKKFDNDTPAKLKEINDDFAMLELWHGPTCAFKDMALQILPHLLSYSLKKCEDGKVAVILVATSGDTGKAALEGFKDVENTKIMVFYPENGVSPMQLKQMNTQEGSNLTVCAIQGNFDDCQTQVKKIFTDKEIQNILAEKNMVFSSANSINWGRLLPQIVYYFSAYLDMVSMNRIKLGEEMNVVVPTGNFGNILAAYYAKQMGVPIKKLICASNSNNVLTDFINSGTYDKGRNFYTTISPSMDILVSSNLERLLYSLTGENSEKLLQWMNSLENSGSYTVDNETISSIKELFYGACCNDEETLTTITDLFKENGYLLDTHTAVAVKAFKEYKETSNDETQTVIVSTASPYKFSTEVLKAVTKDIPANDFEAVEMLQKISNFKVPAQISELKDKKVIFNNRAEKDTISKFVIDNL